MPAITIGGFFLYLKLSGHSFFNSNIKDQEQFVGDAALSEQVLTECQQSAEKISSALNLQQQIKEFKENVENCREVPIVIEGKGFLREEFSYADLAVEIALSATQENINSAIELLSYTKELPEWQYHSGTFGCSSRSVLDAYIDAFKENSTNKCLSANEVQSEITEIIKTKNFSDLKKLIAPKNVVSVSAVNSDLGCPASFAGVLEIIERNTDKLETLEFEAKTEKDRTNYLIKNKDKSDLLSIGFALDSKNKCYSFSSLVLTEPLIEQ